MDCFSFHCRTHEYAPPSNANNNNVNHTSFNNPQRKLSNHNSNNIGNNTTTNKMHSHQLDGYNMSNTNNNHHSTSESMHSGSISSIERPNGGALALHYAAARGCLDCVQLLVAASADIW